MHPTKIKHSAKGRAVLFATLLLAAMNQAVAQPAEADLKALGTVYSLGVVGSFTRDWCMARAPQTKTVVTNGYNAWLKDTRLDVINQKAAAAFGGALSDLKVSLETKRQEVYAELDKAAKNPAQECQGIRAVLGQQMNPQKLAPSEYAAALKVQTGNRAAAQPAAPTAAPAGNSANPEGMKLGGPLTLGTYNCTMPIDGYSPSKFSLSLYAGGQYRETAGSTVKNDTYTYDSSTGKIDISVDRYLYNSSTDDSKISVFAKDARGTPLIVAEHGRRKVLCLYAGANKLPSPAQAAAAKTAAADQKLNLYRTAPNAGLKLSQIKTIIHDYSSSYDGQNTNVQENDTLLLNDGTAYLNLRWTPHDLDAKASRAGEPQNWTKWRYQGEYQILQNGKWVKLEGMPMAPFGKGERLSGAYSYKSYYKVGWYNNASVSYSESNLYFAQNGTFDTGRLARTTGGTDMGAVRTSGVAQSTDSGTKGSYSADGYTLQLKYADGTVQRNYGFFWNSDKKRLVINGTTYSR